jgi:lysophospholipase L1-like esterase
MLLLPLLAFAPMLLAQSSQTGATPVKRPGLPAKTSKSASVAPKPATSKTLRKTTQNGITYKKINAFQTAKVTPSTRVSSRSRRSGRVAPIISPALRASALSLVSQRMDAVPNHFEETQALRPFFDRMAQDLRTGQPIHILQYGDSHTASDDWVESMREAFQGRYGFGGAGFTMPGRPFKGYRRFDSRGQSSSGWVAEGLVNHPGDGRHGLSGVSMTASRPGETLSLTTSGERLELYYMRQPGGGSFVLEEDGQQVETIHTDGELTTSIYTLQPSPGEHTYSIRTVSYQPVRLFGWASDNKSGVTWETLGINGAQAGMLLNWDEMLWSQQIQHRDPALIVIAYGTNEAISRAWTAADYRESLLRVIERFRNAVPNASLLLVGPPDCGKLHPFPHLQEVVAVQREVAEQTGIAFWDWRHHMGGPGATHMWVRAGLSQADYVHLTGDGYRMLGKTLAEEISLEYRRYVSSPIASTQVGSF